MVITDQSPVAAGGIASFHPCSKAVGLKDHDRPCGSLVLLIQDSFSMTFRYRNTRSYDAEFTLRPLYSAVWTFLSDVTRSENADSNVPYNYIKRM